MEEKAKLRPIDVLIIVFISGACSLAYQVVWLRELKLIFGASTLANSAVLAAFMGGLGLGGAVLGRRCEKSSRPLHFYSNVELTIATLAFLTPAFLWIGRIIYSAMGGSISMGNGLSTVVRLFIAVLVVGLPAFFMGGTLPALARASTGDDDEARGFVAKLYGINTIGAVVGATTTTFFTLEVFGQRQSLWFFALLNFFIAFYARSLSRDLTPLAVYEEASDAQKTKTPLIWAGAFVTGFAFFALELVWYRVSAPLLGGSTYSFGIILIVALAGIGTGGYLQSRSEGKPSALGFALSNALAAFVCLVPFALGDNFAMTGTALRQISGLGFGWLVGPWVLLCAVMVFPTALVAGYQFPLLLGLKGAGRDNVATDVGDVYAVNTIGAIVGAMVGGFWILPALGAEDAWRICAFGFALLAILFLGKSIIDKEGVKASTVMSALLVVATVALSMAEGPSFYWRTSPIGAGRAKPIPRESIEISRQRLNLETNVSEVHEGREAHITYRLGESYALLTNGKSDGSVIGDAQTQIGLAFVGPILHQNPKSAFVVGLGTGQTAGWLAEMPGITKVQVAEIEPAVVRFAKLAKDTNFNATEHPEVEVLLTDGREALIASKEKYDIIVSEPSNPYRAGLASFYTREFYASAKEKMNQQGVFVQWIQAYEITPQTLASGLKTMRTAFQNVEVFCGRTADLIVIATNDRFAPLDVVRKRLQQKVPQEALAIWNVPKTIEGFFSHRRCGVKCVDKFIDSQGVFENTDDNNHLDFAFARSVGSSERADNFLIEYEAIPTLDNALIERLHDRKLMARYDKQKWAERYPEDAKLFLRRSAPESISEDDKKDPAYLKKVAEASPISEIPEEVIEGLRAIGAKGDAELFTLAKTLKSDPTFEETRNSMTRFATSLRARPWVNERVGNSFSNGLREISKKFNKQEREALAQVFKAPFAARVYESSRLRVARQLVGFQKPNDVCLEYYRGKNARLPEAKLNDYILLLKCARNRDEALTRVALRGLSLLKGVEFTMADLAEITDADLEKMVVEEELPSVDLREDKKSSASRPEKVDVAAPESDVVKVEQKKVNE